MPRATGRRGQWRYRPNADVTPATREVGARVQAGTGTNGNGITTGKFIQPIMDDGFIFPELNVFGDPEIVYEFNLLQHLAQGSGPWLGGIPGQEENLNGPIVGQLDPWPGAVAPSKAGCSTITPQVPKANAGLDQAVASGALVTLTGRSDTTNIPGERNSQFYTRVLLIYLYLENTITYLWQQIVEAGPTVALSGAGTKTATFTAPTIAAALTFNLTTSTTVGSTSDQVVINVSAPVTGPDTVRCLT